VITDSKRLQQSRALAQILVSRLERLSADSYYAHQASGVRGALLRRLSQAQDSGYAGKEEDLERLEKLTSQGFELLEKAAREV
jgi:hypothetical protein